MNSFMQKGNTVPASHPNRYSKFSGNANFSLATLASASAALTTPATASVVQITLTNNLFSTSSDSLNGDLTGDTNSDFPFITGTPSTRVRSHATTAVTTKSRYYNVRVNLSPSQWVGSAGYAYNKNNGVLGSQNGYRAAIGFSVSRNSSPRDIHEFTSVSFTDSRINDGNPTRGLLEIRAFNTSKTEHTVQLLRLIFDNADTREPSGVVAGVPELEFVPGNDATDDLVDAFIDSTSIAEKRAIHAKLKKLENGIKKLKKKLRRASGVQRFKIKKTLKKKTKIYRQTQRVAAIGVRG